MKELNATVGLFDTHDQAAEAVKMLGKGGFPMNKVLKYVESIKAGKYLVVAHGSKEEVNKAKEILEGQKASTVEVH